MRYFALLAAPLLVAAPFPAFACSVAPDYRVPTNLALVESAGLILLGTVTDGDFAPGSSEEQMVTVEPAETLKGAMPTGPVALPGMIATGTGTPLSNPYELGEAHPQSFAGACIRYVFPRGSRVLFFLDRQDGGWRAAGGAFSRWAEDVLTDDAPWLQLVRFYIDIAKLPEAERADALVERRDELAALGDDPVAQLVAADIDRQLAGPNPPLRGELPPAPDPADAESAEEMIEAADAAAAVADGTDTESEREETDIEREDGEPRD
ncbi:hypothetical protein [Sphingopyxis sp. JAI128]|uniref:hypothetical protein n=1 Tax=Sphingopyxis sp. JAI128 TaxID=2723066 RepID=UPI0016136C23|nr:hypothetical protein [Sphingopyxis sp. JAI128]MBB6425817.1 hypothetical protein [Sphingopyxis sp. JAI128]